MKPDDLDLLRDVVDHALLDMDGAPCGMVDDLEMEEGPDGEMRVTALLVGPGAWGPRLPRLLGGLTARLAGHRLTRVPWEEVSVIGEKVLLRSKAEELGLGETERALGRWIARLPGS